MAAPVPGPRGGLGAGIGISVASDTGPPTDLLVTRAPATSTRTLSGVAVEAARALRGEDVAGPATVPELALRRLLAGNRRFLAGRPAHPRQDLRRVRAVSSGQAPLAMSLGCADSRVPPETLFDQGIGDLFDQRVAGHVVDDSVLGSIEYAAEHLGVPLLLVLGHGGCGAVAATVASHRSGQNPGGHVAAIVDAIRPAVEPVLAAADPATPHEHVMTACELANVGWVMGQIRARSKVVAELESEGRLAVVGAFYHLGSGAVSLLG
jgi:carbonic anhydrase